MDGFFVMAPLCAVLHLTGLPLAGGLGLVLYKALRSRTSVAPPVTVVIAAAVSVITFVIWVLVVGSALLALLEFIARRT